MSLHSERVEDMVTPTASTSSVARFCISRTAKISHMKCKKKLHCFPISDKKVLLYLNAKISAIKCQMQAKRQRKIKIIIKSKQWIKKLK